VNRAFDTEKRIASSIPGGPVDEMQILSDHGNRTLLANCSVLERPHKPHIALSTKEERCVQVVKEMRATGFPSIPSTNNTEEAQLEAPSSWDSHPSPTKRRNGRHCGLSMYCIVLVHTHCILLWKRHQA